MNGDELMDDVMTDHDQMVWLNRAHLNDDHDVPDDPRDWTVDE
jgi:hypothetical protein